MERLEREKRTVEQMIRLYCTKVEGNKDLCSECKDLLDYSVEKLVTCPFGDRKESCKKCKVHCYAPDMREKIRRVMRFSGPRMFFYHPIAALRYLIGY